MPDVPPEADQNSAVRTFSLVIALLLLGSSEGFAFECSGVRLPSSLVICSDAELMKLADERQEASSQAMATLDSQQQKELLADQNGWVRSYAAACGAPAGAAPPVPVPDKIRECFKRAAQARIAYITSYGLAGGALPSVAATPPTAQVVSPATPVLAPPAPATAPNATAGMCDEPPYGADPKRYKLYIDTLGELGNLGKPDLFPNICRAKYKGDEKIRKSLVDVGLTS